MLFKKTEKGKEGKIERPQKKYITTDTKLGRWYNKQLNDNYSIKLHSNVLDYEMVMTVKESVDTTNEWLNILEERINRLERAAKEAGGYADTSSKAYPKRHALILPITKDYDAKLGDVILVDATDGAVTVTLPRIDNEVYGDAIVVKKMDHSVNAVTITNIEGQEIGAIRSQNIYQVMTAKCGFWDRG